jgi:hypothetical protein
LTSAFLTLEVIPVLYTIWRTRQLAAGRIHGSGNVDAAATTAANWTDEAKDEEKQVSSG